MAQDLQFSHIEKLLGTAEPMNWVFEQQIRETDAVVFVADPITLAPSVRTRASVLLDLLAVEKGTMPVEHLSLEAAGTAADICVLLSGEPRKDEVERSDIDVALKTIRRFNPTIPVDKFQTGGP